MIINNGKVFMLFSIMYLFLFSCNNHEQHYIKIGRYDFINSKNDENPISESLRLYNDSTFQYFGIKKSRYDEQGIEKTGVFYSPYFMFITVGKWHSYKNNIIISSKDSLINNANLAKLSFEDSLYIKGIRKISGTVSIIAISQDTFIRLNNKIKNSTSGFVYTLNPM